jgi:hypothetical protein
LAISVDAVETTVTGITLLNAGDENTVYLDVANTTLTSLSLPEPLNSIVFNFDGTDGSTSISSSSGTAGSAVATVYGTAALDTSNKKFGTASLYLDGPQTASGDWITYDVPTAFGLDDFCIEFWVYTPASAEGSVYSTLYSFGNLASVDIDYIDNYYLLYFPGGAPAAIIYNVAYDQWQHIAVYRISGTFYLAVDGVVQPDGGANIDFDELAHIVGDFSGGGYVVTTTWVDEIRVTYNDAVYGTTTFSPPAGPF